MGVGQTIGNRQEHPVLLEQVLRHRAQASCAAVQRRKVVAILAMNIIAIQAERAAAAGVHGHDHHAVAQFHPTGLRDFDDFTGRFMAPQRIIGAGGESLVFGAHWRGVDFDDDPVVLRSRRCDSCDAGLLFSRYGDLFHSCSLMRPIQLLSDGAQSVF